MQVFSLGLTMKMHLLNSMGIGYCIVLNSGANIRKAITTQDRKLLTSQVSSEELFYGDKAVNSHVLHN